MPARINTGTVAVRAIRPAHARGRPWALATGRVAADSEEEAASFARAITASFLARHRAADLRRELGWPAITYPTDSGRVPAWRSRPGGHGPTRGETDWRTRTMSCPVAPVVDDAPAPPIVAPAKATPTRTARTARTAAPEPIAPAPAAEDPMGPCPRCKRTDWRTPAGRSWHLDNNPDCVKYRKPAEHKYAEVA